MEASKEGEPNEPAPEAPETLPSEMKEEKKGFPKMLAVIIVVILVIAAIGAAFGLGLFGKKKEATNEPPVAGASATTGTGIDIGGSVSFSSSSTDPDGTIANYTWYFGDGTTDTGPTLANVTHTYQYGGFYWVLLKVTDNGGLNATTEASMIRVTVTLYNPTQQLTEWDSTTHPYAFLTSDADIVAQNTTVNFNATTSYGIGGFNASDPSNSDEWVYGPDNITLATLDFGDGSAVFNLPLNTLVASHMYTTAGHYAAKLTVYSDNNGTNVSTTVIRTIHVLTPGTTAISAKNPNSFIEATIGEPFTLDPAIDYESAGGNILQNVYETLVWYNGQSASDLKPMLATAVPSATNGLISADGLNYTFNIRPNVKFHDGAALTADDAVFSFKRVLTMHDPNGAYWMFDAPATDNMVSYIGKTVQDWENQSTMPAHLVSYLEGLPGGTSHVITQADYAGAVDLVVVKDSAMSLTIHLAHAYAGFNAICAFTMMSPISQAFVTAHGDAYMKDHEDGTGPYKLVSWEVGSKIHLTKFTDYWGTQPKLADVYIIKSDDVNTRMLMLQAGDVDNIYLPIKYQDSFTGNSNYIITKGDPTVSLTFFVFNFNIDAATANSQYGGTITNDFFQDVHMRKAFAYMFNYSLYISSVAMNNAITPNGPIPKGMDGYNASTPMYDTNLTMAANELKLTHNPTAPGQSWYQTGFTIPLFFNSGNTARQTACGIIKSALESIHAADPSGSGAMTATVTGLDWSSAYLPDVLYNDHSFAPMYSIGWAPDYYDPDDYATPMLDSATGTYPIYSGYNNTTVDQAVRAAAKENDSAVRTQMYMDIQTMAFNDCPYIWLSQANNFNIFRSWVKGTDVYFNPMYSDLYYPVFSK
jgi:peptide/nickel transport system substrate-binding protein